MKHLIVFVGCLFVFTSVLSQEDNTEFELVQVDTTIINDTVEVRELVPLDYTPDFTYLMVEKRLATLTSGVPLHLNDRVFSFIDYFAVRNREYLKNVQQRASLYFPIFEKYLKDYGLPDELKYLAIVESGLRTNAISRAGAGGLWQFMPSTGHLYKLHQDWYIDERMDPVKATEAACKYLRQLHSIFGDWELALAAYNSGPGNVRKAIRRSGYKKSFWEIYKNLPRETRAYLPQFVAILYTMKFHEEHNLYPAEKEYLMAYDTIFINQYIHLETFASLTGLCAEDILKLNPHLLRGIIPQSAKNYPLRLPVDKIDFVNENREFLLDSAGKVGKKDLEMLAKNTPGSSYGRTRMRHKVQPGEVMGSIARRYHVKVSDIKAWNNISGNLIRAGQHLNIWVLPAYQTKGLRTTPSSDADEARKGQVASLGAKKQDSEYYLVQQGDTLWDISRKHGNVSIEKLKQINKLSTNRIEVGQKLLLR